MPISARSKRKRKDGRVFNPGAARHLQARIREQKALDLRLEGKSYLEIGQALDITEVGAYMIIMRLLDRYDTVLAEKTEQARRQEIEHCLKLRGYLQKKVKYGDTKAILASLKVSERLSRLRGLDAPVDVNTKVSGSLSIDDFRKLLDEGEKEETADAVPSNNGDEG